MFHRFCIILISILTIPALAETAADVEAFYLSDPDFCDADEGDIEDNSIIRLTSSGLATHEFSCEWPLEAGKAILRGEQSVLTTAQCGTATSRWQAELEIVQWNANSVRIFQNSGGISPVRFYRCGE
ncbi:hypothetical protein G5B38_16790 [Pseudohalocynthiibacter aestuariivivens]|nr:hypothetical protein [Pseudohalocynthiibacter aestuariivivens]QIE47048.1 hypothetical protein G5B38_16790 [Pseudohalocynthiibacter aestuariivivens]